MKDAMGPRYTFKDVILLGQDSKKVMAKANALRT